MPTLSHAPYSSSLEARWAAEEAEYDLTLTNSDFDPEADLYELLQLGD